MNISIYKGDITTLKVDGIVNAANSSLLGGSGVDGAIHSAAGPSLLSECRKLGGCNIGEAKITKGYNLKAKYIIHTVGPVWAGGRQNEEEMLTNCYRNSLLLAERYRIRTIAFPNISTGVYGYPKEEAAEIAVRSVSEYGQNKTNIRKVIFCVFNEENYRIYNRLLKRLMK